MLRISKYGISPFILGCLFLCPGILHAQKIADTLKLKEFEVIGNYPVNNNGFKKVRIDSTILVQNLNADLSTLLSKYSSIFIKTYGNGSLATPSFRGTSAHHTQVEWNGISLNSPMMGQTDLAILPVSQFDGIEIIYGGAGLFNSSGAFGGIINLVSEADWNNRLNIDLAQSFASFDTYKTTLNVASGTQHFQSLTKANFSTSLNNFEYNNTDSNKVERQTNAACHQYGLSEDLFFRMGRKHFLSLKMWYSNNYRQIPPNISSENIYDPEEEDKSLRGIVEYKFLEKKYNITVRSALIDDYMNYRDSVEYIHKYYSSVNRIRFNWVGIRNLTIKPGIDFTYDLVDSDSYEDVKTRTNAGLFGEVVYDASKKIKLSLVLREDLVDGDLMPFTFAGGIQYKPLKKFNWSMSANVSRNYRMPTLNDKYWYKSGNPDLKQEQSVMVEAGNVFNFLTAENHLFMEGELTGYYSWITNLILWQPVEGNSYLWKPVNLATVHARGIEAGITLKYQIRKWSAGLNSNYTYCRSTNEKSEATTQDQEGKQLIYIPVHSFNSTINAGWKTFYVTYNFVYTSRRYTGTDNETYMPGYNLSNIFFGKNINLKNIILSLQLEINNLFDLDYQSIVDRPMPGRNYGITLRGQFKK